MKGIVNCLHLLCPATRLHRLCFALPAPCLLRALAPSCLNAFCSALPPCITPFLLRPVFTLPCQLHPACTLPPRCINSQSYFLDKLELFCAYQLWYQDVRYTAPAAPYPYTLPTLALPYTLLTLALPYTLPTLALPAHTCPPC